MISTGSPFVLRLSKDERRVFQQNQRCELTLGFSLTKMLRCLKDYSCAPPAELVGSQEQ